MEHITKLGYRVRKIANTEGADWLFLPGGPGLGSDYLFELCDALKVPGSKYLVDFPKDGFNDSFFIICIYNYKIVFSI